MHRIEIRKMAIYDQPVDGNTNAWVKTPFWAD
jgi:hypothetical protein